MISDLELQVEEFNKCDIPIRFKILMQDMSLQNKAIILKKIEQYSKNFAMNHDNVKFECWLNSLIKIPFNIVHNLPININNSQDEINDYLINAKKILDDAVYGHDITKTQILQLLSQWITNPNSNGNVLGIQGPMGNGKTTLIKSGVSKAINRPFCFITLGGCSDASYLDGYGFTYEGSTYGRIVNELIKCKCSNPIFYFDELDKVSNTPKGEEIINLLIHITDSSQNDKFQDKYFSGIDINLSKSIFIFSYNDISKISPILLDRLINIKTFGFSKDEKVQICNKYLIKSICDEYNMNINNINISDDMIEYIIDNFTDEQGVRTLKKCLDCIISKINMIMLTQNDKILVHNISNEIPITLNMSNIDNLLNDIYKLDNYDSKQPNMYI